MKHHQIGTSHCAIAVSDSEGPAPAVLMIHGNSSCKEVFRNQLQGEVGRSYRCIAMDLPGHGGSADADDPKRSYTMPGYADAALELMTVLGIERYAVLGWSLGGHVGIEMIARSDAVAGLMISGSPPVSKDPESLGQGFLPSEHMHLAGQNVFSDAEAEAYAHATCGINAPFEPFLLDAVKRTDGRAREIMFAAFGAGEGVDQAEIAATNATALAIVNGADEPFVNNAFVTAQSYANLWDDKVYLLDNAGHAPFWEAPDRFDPLLLRFLRDTLGNAS